MKYCKDCKHLSFGGRGGYRCDGVSQVESPVWGAYTPRVHPVEARAKGGECGPEARLFELREPLLARFARLVTG